MVSSFNVFFAKTLFLDLLKDKKYKIKIVERIQVTGIQELTESEKRQWKALQKNYTHKIYVDFGNKVYIDSDANSELLNAKFKEIEYSKYAGIFLKEELC